LLPSLREKKRYVAFEVISKSSLQSPAIIKAVEQSVLSLGGEVGTAAAGLYVLPNLAKQKGLLRCAHNSLDLVRAGLCSIAEINGENVIVHSLGASGSLQKVKNIAG